MNIVEWIQQQGFADNQFQARNIANGLQLAKLHGDMDAQKARVRLYRDWRKSGCFKKSDRKSCFEKAIVGEAVPMLDLEPTHTQILEALADGG